MWFFFQRAEFPRFLDAILLKMGILGWSESACLFVIYFFVFLTASPALLPFCRLIWGILVTFLRRPLWRFIRWCATMRPLAQSTSTGEDVSPRMFGSAIRTKAQVKTSSSAASSSAPSSSSASSSSASLLSSAAAASSQSSSFSSSSSSASSSSASSSSALPRQPRPPMPGQATSGQLALVNFYNE